MNQCPPGPQVFNWSHFEFFRKFAEIFANYFSVIAGVADIGEQFITGDNDTGNNFDAGDNDTGDKFIAGHKNKDAIEVGSCQEKEKVEGDKSAISPAAEVGHGRRWCHWNRHEKLHPKTPHTS
jgi:hypothetical protein